MNKKEITHLENEKIRYNGKLYNPNYNLKLSEKLLIRIIKNFRKNKKKKDYHYNSFNCLNIVFQDLFWQYCVNYIKYSVLIKKIGIFKKVNDKKKIFLFSGYLRIKKYFINNLTFKQKLISILKIIYLYFWTFKNLLLFNSNKIWVTKELFENFRFDLKNKINEDFLIINFGLGILYSNNSRNIEDAMQYHLYSKLDKMKHWLFSISLLKPKKIILLDNLHNDYSILLAAKKKNIRCIGISHGVTSKYHKGIFGIKGFDNSKILKFDKLYVMDNIYKKNLVKNGNIYTTEQIKISGLLGKKYKKIKRENYKLVLYPFEFLTNLTSINKTLSFFSKRGYKIIVKKRPDINNYGQFENLKFDLVNDFCEEHFKNALCIVGLSSSIIFELSFTGIPIVTPKNTNFNLYDDIKLPNQYFFDIYIENKLKNHKPKIFKNIITQEFLNEFKKAN